MASGGELGKRNQAKPTAAMRPKVPRARSISPFRNRWTTKRVANTLTQLWTQPRPACHQGPGHNEPAPMFPVRSPGWEDGHLRLEAVRDS